MSDAAKQKRAEADADHGFADVAAALVVADEAAPAHHPAEGPLYNPSPREDMEAEPPRVCRLAQLLGGWGHDEETSNRFSPEVRQRAVRMVLDHGVDHASQWATIGSVAAKIGCTAETRRKWVRQANEILRKASAYSAMAELGCRSEP